MKDSPYSKFDTDDLILRDQLAIDRTLLANERTLLAYLRSGVVPASIETAQGTLWRARGG